jgi:molybdate transport system substrate-binding protein
MRGYANARRRARAWGRRVARAALLAAVVSAGWPATVRAQPPTRVAAASSLSFALTEIAEQFRREHGERVSLVFGASGTLTRQIQDGAPFELFLAADETFPKRLADAGLTRDAGVVYAVGRLVLFAPTGSPLAVDPQLAGLTRLVASGGAIRFAIANPAVAPYGQAAEAVLRKYGLWDRLRPSLVLGDTIAQAAQFATSGNAAGGLVAYSLVMSPELRNRGTYALIDASGHEPLRQRMVLLKTATPTAQHFYAYLQEPRARAVLRRFGFEVPE